MQCHMFSYMVPEGPPYYANGAARAVTKCETHNWTFDGPATEMCPIGRIELATDDAIRRIHGHAALAIDELDQVRK